MTRKNHIWEQIKKDFKTGIPKSEFKTWLSQASLKEIDSNHAVIEVQNKFVAHWLKDNYSDHIQTILRNNLKTRPKLRFTYTEPLREGISKGDAPTTQEMDIPHGLNARSTFASFVPAKSNRLAYSSALDVVDTPASSYNPLYIYSTLSLGKTHLLNAIGNHALQRDPSSSIFYLSSERFVADYLFPTGPHAANRFWEREEGPDFFLIDDIHRLADREEAQQEFLNLCKGIIESDRQLAVAAVCPPAKLHNILPQLRSHLEWGLIAEIHPPSQRTKMKILKKKAKQEKMTIPDDVLFFLASATNDLKTLNRYLMGVKNHASTYKRRIDISTAESIINEKWQPAHNIDFYLIQKTTARYFNISLSDLLSNKRARTFSYPRQIAIYLSKNLTSFSLKEIGTAFGNKHHSTVIYAANRIEKAQSQNREILNDINKLKKIIARIQGQEPPVV